MQSLLSSYYRVVDKSHFDIHFVTCETGIGSDADAIKAEGGRVIEAGSLSNPVSYVAKCRRLFEVEGYDIVQACMNSLNVFPLAAARLAKTPVRISYNLSASHPGENNTIAKTVLRKFGRTFATDCAANSALSWDWLFGAPHPGEKRSIIPNSLDVKSFQFDPRARKNIRHDLGLEDCYVIGHIGRYEYQKNHDFLVDVFDAAHRRNRNARLVLVGYGALKEKVFEKIRDRGLSPYVTDLGATREIAKLYSCFDCFMLPSFYEGMPVVGLEAQAASCPCVFSDEVTEETRVSDRTLFLPLDASPDEWAETVLGFGSISRPDSEKGRKIDKFDATTLGRRLEKYYEQLVQASVSERTDEIVF